MDDSGLPAEVNELQQLSGQFGSKEKEYAEITAFTGDIFETDNCK